MRLEETVQSILLEAAREAIRRRLGQPGEAVAPRPELPEVDGSALQTSSGCFVSLHSLSDHRLRGCVGQLEASAPLIEAVAHAARGVTEDPRFTADPVTLPELPNLEIEITVLSPLRPASGPLDFDPLQHGIVLGIGQHSGCFLPQVARDTGWTREQLLDRLCSEKLELERRAWERPDAVLRTFTTQIIGPRPFVEGG